MFKDVTVKQRIWFGFGLMIVGLCVMAVLSIGAMRNIHAAMSEQERTSAKSVLVSAVFENMLEARVAALQYLLTDQTQYLDAARQHLANINTSRERARDQFAAQPDLAAELGAIFDDKSAYAAALDELERMRRAERTERMMTLPRLASLRTELEAIATEANQNSNALIGGAVRMAQQNQARLENQVAELFTEPKSVHRDAIFATLNLMGLAVDRMSIANVGTISGRLDAITSAIDEIRVTTGRVAQFALDTQTMKGDLEELGAAASARANRMINRFADDVAANQAESSVLAARTINSSIALTALLIAIGLLTALLVGRSIIRPLNQLTQVLRSIAGGADKVDMPAPRTDEFGQIVTSVQLIEDRAAEATRFKQAMDCADTLVMVADTNHVITFMSRALTELMTDAEAEIRRDLPTFSADTILGSSVDIFHAKPEHQRGMLDALTSRHEANISLGVKRFTLSISPVFNTRGERSGSVVEWFDNTDQIHLQNDIDDVIRGAIAGDFSRRIATRDNGSLLTEMGTNVNTLLKVFDDGLREVNATLSSMAEGDLSQRMSGDHKGSFAELQRDLNTTIEKIADLVGDIQITTHEIEQNTSTISDEAQALSRRTENQASSLEETAATMDEMTSTIKNNAENAEMATELSNITSAKASEGEKIVRSAVEAMTRIEESSEKMSQIISVIDSIAFQTNLLALNAAVEAARAGDAGKGFAVVAAEVRTLAQRSGDAAKDINELISFSSGHVAEGADLVKQTGAALEQIISSVEQVNSAITDITAMSKEQATGVDEISSALSEMDSVTQKNAAMAEQSATRASRLAEKAVSLSDLVKFFQTSDAVRVRIEQAETTAKQTVYPEPKSVAVNAGSTPQLSAEEIDDGWKEF
ncbi:MAG: methyl-accepting chemotaxis protein [Pseudomonadota bacterium]